MNFISEINIALIPAVISKVKGIYKDSTEATPFQLPYPCFSIIKGTINIIPNHTK